MALGHLLAAITTAGGFGLSALFYHNRSQCAEERVAVLRRELIAKTTELEISRAKTRSLTQDLQDAYAETLDAWRKTG